MQCYRPTELPQTVREIEALSWSEDQRLAVTSSEKIYIFVSLHTHTVTRTHGIIDLTILFPELSFRH